MWDWRSKLSRNKVIVGEPAVGELIVVVKILKYFFIQYICDSAVLA